MKIEFIGKSTKNENGLIESNGSIIIETSNDIETGEIKDIIIDTLKLVNERSAPVNNCFMDSSCEKTINPFQGSVKRTVTY